MPRILPLLVAALGLVSSAFGRQADPPAGPWTVEHVLKQERLADVDVAPDGRRVLWTRRTPDFDEDETASDVYLSLPDDAGAGAWEAVRLTRTGDNSDARWSPDGRWIAFLSTREHTPEGGKKKVEGRQIWLLDARGGAPAPLTALENGVQRFRWLDADRLVFAAREAPSHFEKQRKEGKDTAVAVEDTTEFHPVRLFTVGRDDREVRRLTDNEAQIGEIAPSPDGRHLVYEVQPSPITADARHQPRQYLLDVAAGTAVEIFAERYFDPDGFVWALDGSGFYAADEFSSDPENEGAGIERLYWYDLEAGTHREVPLGWPAGVGYGGYAVTPDGIHVQLADGPRMRPRFYRRAGDTWRAEDVGDERLRHTTSFTLGPDGRTLVFDTSRPDRPPHYLVGRYEQGRIAEVDTLARLNAYLDRLPMPRAEVIEWTGAEGATVNGILYYPLDYREGRRYPLVTAIHGGPSGVDLDAWRLGWTIYPGLVAQRGAFLFRPNYHGSGHHGLAWVESIKGRYYELELPDIVSGIDHLVDRGLVDRDSLGVMGWSNGAILTTALTVEHPELFKVALPGAGDVNWISDYGNCSFGVRFNDSYFRGPPWEHLDHYIEKSPLFRLDRVTTPTLIHHGEKDRAVPTEQGWQYYRALQQMGNAPVRFVMYPGEPHGLRRPSHQRRKVEEDLAWLDTYLFGTTSMPERLTRRVLPPTAPLALLERTAAVARTDGRYGERVGGVPVPETVVLGDTLAVGRFEVTRAQFAASDPAYVVAPGTDDYPASGLSLEQAQAYVAWLSEATGRRYRLPTAAELEALRRRAGPSENDLAHWAGYAPTPDERAALAPLLARHAPDRLLLPVGSRPPAHADDPTAPLLYDLDGNVAEWGVDGEGGRPVGDAAVTLRDEKAAAPIPPPAAFVGLRVVRER